jgi:hypothetical protein
MVWPADGRAHFMAQLAELERSARRCLPAAAHSHSVGRRRALSQNRSVSQSHSSCVSSV